MKNKFRVCTISKYPPYMSGHSFEAMYQGKALFELTGEKQYELTYDPSLYNIKTNYNNSSELMYEAERYAHVYRVLPALATNLKVIDGNLIKAFIGRLIELIEEKDISVLSTFYIDPHSYIANQAAKYAKEVLKKQIITAHKAVGSDVLNSIANHTTDGEGKFLLLQLLQADILFAVSEYTKGKLIEYARDLLPKALAEKFEKTKVLYAPFDNAYFLEKNDAELAAFKKRFRIKQDYRIVSYFGRLFPEKGVDDLLIAFNSVKKKFPQTQLVIGGQGTSSLELKRLAQLLGTPDVIFTGGVSNAEKRALMQLSFLGVIPTKPILNFVETLCICSLEYQAAGTPLLTTRVGGVPEAAGNHSLYAKHSNPKDIAEKISKALSGNINREKMITEGLHHVKQFNYLNLTKKFLSYVEQMQK